MNLKYIEIVEVEIKRFRQKAKTLKDAINADKGYLINGYDTRFYSNHPKETGALRRASLDLTRVLAEFRKPSHLKPSPPEKS
jgi:hypothetical protein